MIYVIDHKDSFTHNVVHQFSLFDDVKCDDFSKINKSKLNQASTIVFSLHAKNPRRQKALTNNCVLWLVFIFSDFTVKII